ncbi:MAG: hypothetical protein JOZ31_05900 [Verrucomicrobia bacterium]|nr:hypothetical protein [Verrucomicrobiota bacterium]
MDRDQTILTKVMDTGGREFWIQRPPSDGLKRNTSAHLTNQSIAAGLPIIRG